MPSKFYAASAGAYEIAYQFDSGELKESAVISILETTAADGKNYPTRYYNLDAIIAVG